MYCPSSSSPWMPDTRLILDKFRSSPSGRIRFLRIARCPPAGSSMLMIVSVILTFSLSLSLCSFSTQKMLQETFPEASSPVVLLIFYTQSAQQIQDLTIHRFRRHADGLGRNLQSFQHKHNISRSSLTVLADKLSVIHTCLDQFFNDLHCGIKLLF